jgi:large subunit ribosomal protein L17
MLSNLAMSVLDHERVTTTVAKAKEVRGVVERLITYGKKGDLHAIRLAARRVNDQRILKKLFEDIAPSYKERNGGYTRVLKTEDRKGDCAPMAIIELVGRAGHNDPVRKRSPGAKKKTPKKAKPVAAPVVEEAIVEEAVVEETTAEETVAAPEETVDPAEEKPSEA